MVTVPAAKRVLDLHAVVQIENAPVLVEQDGHVFCYDADHHRAEADVVQRFMRLSAVEDISAWTFPLRRSVTGFPSSI